MASKLYSSATQIMSMPADSRSLARWAAFFGSPVYATDVDSFMAGSLARLRPSWRRRASVELEEDALARAVVGGDDDCGLVAREDIGDALGTAGVVLHATIGVDDVGDAVLEEDEHLGAVIRAETVAGAEVL